MGTADNDVISTREAAALIGVSVRTVQLWVEAGVLDAWKTQGGHRRIQRQSVEALLRQRSPGGRETGADHATPPTLRILIVEDDPHLQDIYTMAIRGLPFPVDLETAADGFGGLVRAGAQKPHVIIADLMLPGMDGFRMIRRLIELPETRQARIYVISALTSTEIRDRGGLPDTVQIVVKPVPIASILRWLTSDYRALPQGKSPA